MFSAPKPFEATVSRMRSPGTRSMCIAAGASSPAIFGAVAGIASDRPAQIPGPSPLSNTGVHGLGERATDQVNVLANVQHHDGDTAVLADRDALGGGDFVVANEMLERLTSEWRRLGRRRLSTRRGYRAG